MVLLGASTRKCKGVPFITCEILLETLINADVSGLYLVHISGLWDSSLLLHNHCTPLFTAARHCCVIYTELPQSNAAIHTAQTR